MKKLMGRCLAVFVILGLSFGPFSVIADEEPAFIPPVEESELEGVPPVEATTTPPVVADEPEPVAPISVEEVEPAPEPIELIAPIDPDTYVPGEVIVKFKERHIDLEEEQGVEESEALVEKLDLTTDELIEGQNIAVLGTEASIESTIALLEANPGVEYAEPNYIRTIEATTTDAHFTRQWALENTGQILASTTSSGTTEADIDAPEAWTLSKGTGVVVAVIDTGIDYTHPDLADNMWDGSSCTIASSTPLGGCTHGYDFYENDGNPAPSNSSERHGTHVSGIIAAEMNNGIGIAGVAPEAKIMALRVGSTTLSSLAIVRAIDFASENGARIINASFSGPSASDAERDAIANFGSRGGLFIAAAANYSESIEDVRAYPASYDLENIISVAATDENDMLADFSNHGEVSVDLGAPGNLVYSTTPTGYAYLDGTSMAAPHVAGVTALLKAYHPTSFTAVQIKAALLASGEPLDGLCERTVSGKRLNAYNALLGSTTPACDIQPPDISLNGANPFTLSVGDSFADPGVTVTDNVDPSPVLTVTGNVDTSAATTTTLIYTATDANGNSASATRTVVVSTVTPPPSSGGGGGGGGGSTTTKKKTEPAKTVAKPTVIPKPVPVPEQSVPRFPQSQVLGASTSYTFTLTLSLGSTGQEVTELQKKLKELGFFAGEATGYFGPVTETAVKTFQSSKGLALVGVVGPQTRAALNGGMSSATTDTASLQAQIAMLQAQLALLLAQLNAAQ